MEKLIHNDVDGFTILTDSISHTDCGFMELRQAFTSQEQVALHQRASHCH